jgi:iron(III) transport system substrate-binding protein
MRRPDDAAMTSRRTASVMIAVGLFAARRASAELPAGYPADYPAQIAAARREGRVVVYASTDARVAAPLIRDFEAFYPGIRIDYNDMKTTELHYRVVAERSKGEPGADIVWSSAMDQQIKLINDGHAQAYASPEAKKLPPWANWRDEAWGTTYEPVAIVYNRRLLAAAEIPSGHSDLVRLLRERRARFDGRVTTYDIERSGAGFLLITQDSRANSAFWDLAAALGEVRVQQVADSESMLDAIASGDHLIGYNVLGSYAMLRARTDPRIAHVLPRDYTLVLSRIAFIARGAAHPNAARLWLDHLLSPRGQALCAGEVGLGSIRPDVSGAMTVAGLREALGEALRPIVVGPGLLTFLDQAKRNEFVRQWRQRVGRPR